MNAHLLCVECDQGSVPSSGHLLKQPAAESGPACHRQGNYEMSRGVDMSYLQLIQCTPQRMVAV